MSYVSVPICFIFSSFNLNISNFLCLIKVYHKKFFSNLIVMKTLLGICSIIRLFKTNKSERITIFVLKTNLFDFSKLLEKIYNIILCIITREIFNIKITTTFWSFKAKGISKFLLCTISSFQGKFYNKSLAITDITSI